MRGRDPQALGDAQKQPARLRTKTEGDGRSSLAEAVTILVRRSREQVSIEFAPPERMTPKPIDSHEIAAAAVSSWGSVQSRLAPIIGEDGFRVLFARSLHRARIEHPWLARDPVAGADTFSTLMASLEAQAPERAASGSRALMANFNDLLHALIGEELASRLRGPA